MKRAWQAWPAGLLALWWSGQPLPVQAQPPAVGGPDQREVLHFTPEERHFVLGEMRGFVVALQAISSALAVEDMAAVAAAARTMGSHAAHGVPPAVVAKLPPPFREMAGRAHTAFDAIALDAEALGEVQHTLGQMGELMQHCIACHGQYQIALTPR